MLDEDPLATEFAALRAAVLTRPPGPAAAERTVRRRRRRTAVVGTSCAVVLVAALGIAAAGLAGSIHRSTTALPGPRASTADTGAPKPTPAPSGSPSDQAISGTARPGPSRSAACKPSGAVQIDTPMMNTVSVRVDPRGQYPLCPGERVRVFVATYGVDAKGIQHLYRSQIVFLDAAHNPLTINYQVPPCHVAIYVISGNQAIRQTISAMGDFYQQAPTVYYAATAGPYGGVVWVQEEDPCAGAGHPATPGSY